MNFTHTSFKSASITLFHGMYGNMRNDCVTVAAAKKLFQLRRRISKKLPLQIEMAVGSFPSFTVLGRRALFVSLGRERERDCNNEER